MENGATFCHLCGHAVTIRPQPARTTPRPAGHVPDSAPLGPPQASPEVSRLPTAISLQLATGQRFTLRGQMDYAIGRIGLGRNQLAVDLASWYGYEGGVSREHVAIHLRREGVFIEDLRSRNETVQNGFRLMPYQWYPLHDGDEIRLGAIILHITFHYT